MRLMVYLPFVVSALLGLAGPWLGRRLAPATATRLLAAAGLVGAASTTFALAVLVWTWVGQSRLVAALGGWSARDVGQWDPVPALTARAAAVVLALLAVLSVRALVSHAGALIHAARIRRPSSDEADPLASSEAEGISDEAGMVVVDDTTPDAYALPNLPGLGRGHIVVTSGMLKALPADERRVLLAHERAHLRHHHHLYRAAAALAAAANPLLLRLPGTLRYTTERWADEHAAAHVGDRALAARALARASLAAERRTAPSGATLRPAALDFGASQAATRVRSLLEAPPRRRPWTAAVLVAAMTLCLLATNEARTDTESLFEHAELHAPAAPARTAVQHAAEHHLWQVITKVGAELPLPGAIQDSGRRAETHHPH